MSDTFSQIRDLSVVIQRRMDTIANLLHLTAITLDRQQIAILETVMKRESQALSEDSEKLTRLFDQFKEERRQMFKIPSMVALVVLALFLMMGLVSAQDVPLATNTTVQSVVATVNGVPVAATLEATALPDGTTVTPAPTVIAVQEPTNQNSIYVVGFLALLIFSGLSQFLADKRLGTLVDTVNVALNNKQVIDEGHRLYMESSLSVQNFVTLVGGIAHYIGATIPGDDLVDKLAQFTDEVKSGTTDTLPADNPGVVG